MPQLLNEAQTEFAKRKAARAAKGAPLKHLQEMRDQFYAKGGELLGLGQEEAAYTQYAYGDEYDRFITAVTLLADAVKGK